MPTSKLDLMELFAETIMNAGGGDFGISRPKEFRATDSTYFEIPAAELGIASTTLVELLGDNPNLLLALAHSWAGEKGQNPAGIIRAIADFLADPSVDLDMPEYRARRFLDYVYPVV